MFLTTESSGRDVGPEKRGGV